MEEPVVLVVSDQPGFAGIVDRALFDRRVTVSASDVPRAREACADSLPHAIVFDVPERQSVALAVLRELRGEFRTLPILLLSWEHALRAPVSVSQGVKLLHDHECQVCGARIMTDAGPYAEGAHIHPLGRPHNGPDRPENILCLCPNHHVQLDLGGIWIEDDLSVIERSSGRPIGKLRTKYGHDVAPTHLAYHRGLF